MKIKILLFQLLFLFMLPQTAFSFDKIISWKFTNPQNNKTIKLGEKGSIQEAFIREGILPDPLYGMNEKLFDWMESFNWELTGSFHLSNQETESEFIDIELPSVDTYAKVYLNDELILSCENAFLPYRITINKWLKKGKNELKVVFTPPLLYHRDAYLKAPYKLPAINDINKIAIASYTRKPQYQFGWDWTMRMNTVGFNKPVRIVGYQENKILLTSVQTLSISDSEAVLSLSLLPAQDSKGKMLWNSKLFGKINWKKEGNWLKAIVTVAQPKLWWPIHFGEQFLYEDEWTITTRDKKEIETITKKFGIRTAQLLQEKDKYGTAYEIAINNKKIFCKGGNVIPQDVFPSKVTDSSLYQLVEQMRLANFNMVRVWGGGYYLDDLFYEECDKNGIMVWQDFMFACSMYPGTDEFLENVKNEIDYQIPRITSHPSVVILNGNNEVDVAWKNWGFQVKYGLIGKAAKEIEKAYDDLFKKLIPEQVSYFTTLPYIHTSPLSNWGKDEYFKHGSQHYWGVWHGKDPIEDFGRKIGRFNAEYGFQSFPEYSTLSKVIDKKDWSLDSDVMEFRQKSYIGNGMIKKHSDILFGKLPDFETFVYYSQLTQAKAVSMAISGHRVDWPRCAGTLYWQVNDCYPAPTWSSIDYYGNWKALHYEVQKDYENIAVLAVEKELNQKEFYLVADACETFSTTISFDFYDLKGKLLFQNTQSVDVTPQSVNPLTDINLTTNNLSDYITVVKWKDNFGKMIQRTFYNLINKEQLDKNPTVLISLLNDNKNNYTIELTTDKPLLNCWIYTEEKAFHLKTNFETLLPGKHIFEFESKEEFKLEDIKVRYIN